MQSNHSQSSSDAANSASSNNKGSNSIQIHRPQNAGMETEGVEPVGVPGGNSFVGIRISSGLPFPYKLHAMLDNAAEGGYEDIVSWAGDNGFQVHDKDAFVEKIIPKYFSQTKYRSFQRLLNMWGFERLREGPRKGAVYHEQFQRGNPSLCGSMKCQKIKKKPTAATANAAGTNKSKSDTNKVKESDKSIIEKEPSSLSNKTLEKKFVTFDKATKPAARDPVKTAPLPSFEDTFGTQVKQIIPVGKITSSKVTQMAADVFDVSSSNNSTNSTPSPTSKSGAPLPTYSDLFEDRQFHEVSNGDKFARVYGPNNNNK
ncbi:MAG: hypothetical protein SGBAC_012006 [Bacillariaceae sp.]